MRLEPDTIVALDDFLRQPDPPELPARAHRVTCEGRPDRLATLVIPLVVSSLQWQAIAQESGESWHRLSLVRR
jgi:hypothetical protein